MNILILDGHPGGTEAASYKKYLSDLRRLLTDSGHDLTTLDLKKMDLRFCTGCWSCWWATPGECVLKDDGAAVCRKVIRSDLVLFASPMIQGFTSALLKKVQDRLIPLLHPYIELVEGESHHRKRYAVYPRIGLLLEQTEGADDEDVEITVDMFRRFALNFKSRLVLQAMMSSSAREVCDEINGL